MIAVFQMKMGIKVDTISGAYIVDSRVSVI